MNLLNILNITMIRAIGILILCGILSLILYLKNYDNIKQYGAMANIISYFIFVLAMFFAIILVWWAISMIITG